MYLLDGQSLQEAEANANRVVAAAQIGLGSAGAARSLGGRGAGPKNAPTRSSSVEHGIVPPPPPPGGRQAPPPPFVEKVYTENGSYPRLPPDSKGFAKRDAPHHHVVDQHDRPLLAEGWVRSQAAPRHSDQKELSKFMGGKASGTEASHGGGARFGFEGQSFNLTPLPKGLNQGGFKQLENDVAALAASGERVFIQVHTDHAGAGRVPSSAQYQVYVDRGSGLQKVIDKTFYVSH
jgi:hypothetical protein